jgi:exodeoxyribonuclease VII large subunit
VKSAATLEEKRGVLEAVGPEAVLARGYSVTTDAAGRLIRRSDAVSTGDDVVTRVAEGTIHSTVTRSEAE